MARIELVGHRFDKLLVIESLRSTPSGQQWLCRCDCGNEVLKLTTQLRRVKRTGCRACEAQSRSQANTRHGGRKQNTTGTESLYRTWKSMRNRCADKSDRYYGAKGITVCPEWDDYAVFREWALSAGYRDIPSAARGDRLSIDRIDSSKGYSPANCRWLTGRENSRQMALAQKERRNGR